MIQLEKIFRQASNNFSASFTQVGGVASLLVSWEFCLLQFGWDAAKYKGGRGVAAPNEGEDSHQFGVDIAVVDEAIKSQLFWARLKMLESLAIVLRKCLAWAESCPCHSNGNAVLQREDIPKLWASCPVRGCRAPELAAGDFFQCLTGMWTSQALLYFCLCLAI